MDKTVLHSGPMKDAEWDKSWRGKIMDYNDKKAIEKNTLSKRSSRYSN